MLPPLLESFRDVASGLLLAVSLPGVADLTLLTLGGLRPLPRRCVRVDRSFSLAVLVPAHNEEKTIERCIANINAGAETLGCAVSVIVVADNCSDSTSLLAAQAGAIVLNRLDSSKRGKGYALAFGFEYVLIECFDGVLVVDADSMISPNLLAAVVAELGSGADAAQCRYEVLNPADTKSTRLMSLALLGFNVIRPRGRHFWGLSAGIFGNGFALSRKTLLTVPYTSHSIAEDLEFHLQLVREGKRVRFIDGATVLGDMPTSDAASGTQRSRWEGGRLMLARQWALPLLLEVVRGRFRLLEPLLDLLSLPLAYQVLSLILIAALGPNFFRFYALAAFAVLGAHVLAAASAGDNFWSSVKAILSVPFYLAWKVSILPATLVSSRKNATWIRTKRS